MNKLSIVDYPLRMPVCSFLIVSSCSAHMRNLLFRIAVKTLLTILNSETSLQVFGLVGIIAFFKQWNNN